MGRTNVLETARRIRRQLVSSSRPEQLMLNVGIDSLESVLEFVEPLPMSLVPGTTLGIDTELMRVISINEAAQQVTVLRGYLDSIGEIHAAQSLVDVNPRFSLLDILEAMRTELMSWGPTLYYVESDTFTVSLSAETLELPLAWHQTLGVVEVLQKDTDGDVSTWPRIASKLIRGQLGSFDGATTSGMLLRFTEPIRSGQVYVTVAQPFDIYELNGTFDLDTDYHLTWGLIEILELGAKKRIIVDGEYDRIARQPLEPQRFGENTMLQSITSMFQMFEAQYKTRKSQEINKLRRLYPLRVQ